MSYDLVTLCGLARAAGFVNRDVPVAAACAFAASGGATNYHRHVGPGDAHDYRGLWALDVAAYPDYATADLWHPATAATVAADLTRIAGGFGWCYTYRTGVFSAHMDAAETAASVVGARPAGRRVSTVPTSTARIESNVRRHHAIVERLRIARHRRG